VDKFSDHQPRPSKLITTPHSHTRVSAGVDGEVLADPKKNEDSWKPHQNFKSKIFHVTTQRRADQTTNKFEGLSPSDWKVYSGVSELAWMLVYLASVAGEFPVSSFFFWIS